MSDLCTFDAQLLNETVSTTKPVSSSSSLLKDPAMGSLRSWNKTKRFIDDEKIRILCSLLNRWGGGELKECSYHWRQPERSEAPTENGVITIYWYAILLCDVRASCTYMYIHVCTCMYIHVGDFVCIFHTVRSSASYRCSSILLHLPETSASLIQKTPLILHFTRTDNRTIGIYRWRIQHSILVSPKYEKFNISVTPET